MGEIRPAETKTFEHTVSGLLRKRVDLFHEAERLKARVASIKSDIAALDRVLLAFGYEGDLAAVMPRQRREGMFRHGELTRAIYIQLREATGPISSREIAKKIAEARGGTVWGSKRMAELTRNVGSTLRALRDKGKVQSETDRNGRINWSASPSSP